MPESLAYQTGPSGERFLISSGDGKSLATKAGCENCCGGCTTIRRYDRCTLSEDQLPCAGPVDHVWICDPPRCPQGVSYLNACYEPTQTTLPADELPPGDVFIPNADAVCSAGCLPTCTVCNVFYQGAPCGLGPNTVYFHASCFGLRNCIVVPIQIGPDRFCYTVRKSFPRIPEGQLPANAIRVPCGSALVNVSDSCCDCQDGGCATVSDAQRNYGNSGLNIIVNAVGPCCVSPNDYVRTVTVNETLTNLNTGTVIAASGSQTFTVINGNTTQTAPIPIITSVPGNAPFQSGTVSQLGGFPYSAPPASVIFPLGINVRNAVNSGQATLVVTVSRTCYGSQVSISYTDSSQTYTGTFTATGSYTKGCASGGCSGQPSPVFAPVPAARWPAWAKKVAKSKRDGETGVGDTMARLIDKPSIGPFNAEWAKNKLKENGIDCGCDFRQKKYNAKYPY